jgi:hypothetical protein
MFLLAVTFRVIYLNLILADSITLLTKFPHLLHGQKTVSLAPVNKFISVAYKDDPMIMG